MEPPAVRRELSTEETRSALSGSPRLRVRAGALSGKTIYLSAGHGFYRSAPLNRWATQRGNTNDLVEDLISGETVDQYLLPMLMAAGAHVVPVREADLNARMVILNNGGPGYTEEGAAELFSTSTLPGWGPPPVPMGADVEPFQLGGNRLMRTEATATARATWAPGLPVDGYYSVYVSYSAFSARAPDAHYVVRHAGGESHFRVDQRRHGGTWVLLGRFYFTAGAHPETASVVVLNDSAQGGNVSLDAVRFGGGSGAMGDATLGPLARPRFEESARYHTQFSGAPASVFAASGSATLANERTDDIASRPRFAAWHHEEGEDAVYVAWHTNASGAGFRGTEGYVYGPNDVDGQLIFTGVPGSDVLARALLDELARDIRSAVEPNWTVRKLRSARFVELSPSHNPEMPSVLLEVAYHDQVADAARLKEPGFRRLAARAIVQGLIKYFAVRDNQPVHLPPEPPVAVLARNAGQGRVEVRWAPPPTDDTDLGGHAATHYRVYQSGDGRAWDEGTETEATSLTLTLEPGVTRYFRVAAVNAGGESFPSDIVGARVAPVGEPTPVLVVNAFRRMDAALARAEDLSPYALEQPLRLLLEAMNDGTALRRHGEALTRSGVPFDGATTEALLGGLTTPLGYEVLDWFSGRGGPGGSGPTAAEQGLLRGVVSGGGHLLLSGSHVASALSTGSAEDQAFLAEVLRVSAGGTASTSFVEGRSDGWLAGLSGAVLDDGTFGAFPVGGTDVLVPLEGTVVLDYAGTGSAAGVVSSPGGQVLFLGMPLEGLVSPSRRAYVMGAFLARVGVLSTPPSQPEQEPPPPEPGTPNWWAADGSGDPAPPRPQPPPPPPPPPPEPYVVDRVPELYPGPGTGCGCGAGGGGASIAWLLLGVIVQRRRARRKLRFTER
jgi:N-acetylmuramoyl-L-alanine amidase